MATGTDDLQTMAPTEQRPLGFQLPNWDEVLPEVEDLRVRDIW